VDFTLVGLDLERLAQGIDGCEGLLCVILGVAQADQGLHVLWIKLEGISEELCRFFGVASL